MVDRKDFEGGLILGLCVPPRPIVSIKEKGDLLDNEWPIEWKYSEVKGNKVYVSSTMAFRRISDAVGYDYENAACAVTAITADGTTAFTTSNIGVTTQELGKMIVIKCIVGSTTFYTALLVIEEAGTQGTVEFTETGTYFAFLDANFASTSFSDADLQFTLTAPQLVGYSYNGVILPALPEWDREAYPYAVIVKTPVFTRYTIYLAEELSYGYSETGTRNLSVVACTPALTSSSTEWGEFTLQDSTPAISNIVWANFDVLNEDGTVFLAASDPVPVYE